MGALEIAINALWEEAAVDGILECLKSKINQAWKNRETIKPCFKGKEKQKLFNILKVLPKTNCK